MSADADQEAVRLRDLLIAFRDQGDPGALGALFDRASPELFQIALSLLPDVAAAEDALQETWLGVLESAERYDSRRPVMPWLVGVLRFRADRVRRRLRRPPRAPECPRASASSTDAVIDAARREERERIREALADLPDPYREIALLRWQHGLSPAEIADLKTMAPGTVRSLLHRALPRLRRKLAAVPVVGWILGEGASRGLAAVRGTVVARATARRPVLAAGTAAFAGGVLVAKKMLIGGAILLLLLISGTALVLWPGGGRDAVLPERIPDEPLPPGVTGIDSADGGEEQGRTPVAPSAIRGSVVDPEGHPVPKALVLVGTDRLRDVFGDGAKGHDLAHALRTDEAGRFTVSLGPGSQVLLLVDAEGFAPTLEGPIRPGAEVRIVLSPGGRIEGTVVNPDGVPVEGARVKVMGLRAPFRTERESHTDADGHFRVAWLTSRDRSTVSATMLDVYQWTGPRTWVEVTAKGFALHFAPVSEPPPGGIFKVAITLSRGVQLTGRVVDPTTGKGLPGALVAAWRLGADDEERVVVGGVGSWNPFGRRLLARTRTSAEGSFTLGPVSFPPAPRFHPGGRRASSVLRIGAWIEGRVPTVQDAGVEPHAIEIALPRAGLVIGRVVDEIENPVAGASVCFVREGEKVDQRLFPDALDGVPGVSATTDADGRYRLEGCPASLGRLTGVLLVTSGGLRAGAFGRIEFDVPPGEQCVAPDLVLAHQNWPYVRVTVVDVDGEPVWGARVGGTGMFVTTGPDGRAELNCPGATLGNEVAVPVVARGYAPAKVMAVAMQEDPPVARVTLPSGHSLDGVVLDGGGQPIEGALVSLRHGEFPLEEAFPPAGAPPTPALLDPPAPAARTGADGRFAFLDLPSGPYHLRAELSRRNRSPLESTLSGVAADGEDVSVYLPRSEDEPLETITVHVTDAATGESLKMARGAVWVGTERRTGRAHERGLVRIPGVPPGIWSLAAWAEGYAPVRVSDVRVRSGSPPAPLAVELERGADVVGRVRCSTALSFLSLFVEIRPVKADGWPLPPLRSRVDPGSGEFRIQGVPSGRYRAFVFRIWPTAGLLSSSREPVDRPLIPERARLLDVTGPGEHRLDLVLEPGGLLDIDLEDPRLPLANAARYLNTAEQARFGRRARLTVLDGEGVVVVTQRGVGRGGAGVAAALVLPPGEYLVRLELPGDEPRETRVWVKEDERATVRFE